MLPLATQLVLMPTSTDNLAGYLDTGFVYSFDRGPQHVENIEDALKNGLNCVSLAHLALDSLFAYRLPVDLDCVELFYDQTHLDDVDSLAEMELGDLLWFGPENPPIEVEAFIPEYEDGVLTNWGDSPLKHVGIFHGWGEDGEPQILHSTNITGTNTIWPLSRFGKYGRYRTVCGIKRLRMDRRERVQ